MATDCKDASLSFKLDLKIIVNIEETDHDIFKVQEVTIFFKHCLLFLDDLIFFKQRTVVKSSIFLLMITF